MKWNEKIEFGEVLGFLAVTMFWVLILVVLYLWAV